MGDMEKGSMYSWPCNITLFMVQYSARSDLARFASCSRRDASRYTNRKAVLPVEIDNDSKYSFTFEDFFKTEANVND